MRRPPQSSRHSLEIFLNPSSFAAIMLVASFVVALLGYLCSRSSTCSLRALASDLYPNIATELASIAVTILVVARLVERSEAKLEKARLIRQLRSKDPAFSSIAAEELRAHGWLADGSLASADLAGANLTRVNLSGADLSRANLYYATIYEANLSNATLYLADLEHADLTGANLVDANLDLARLIDTDLSEAFLTNATLRGATLIRAKLRKANLVGADLARATIRNCDLEGALVTPEQIALALD